MPIEFNCEKCDRVVKAPDHLKGKKARCPSCKAVVEVPEAVYDAVEVSARPVGAIAAAPAPAAPAPAASAEARQPCPVCGEMIMPGARKCRFCASEFEVDCQPKGSSYLLANQQKAMAQAGIIWIGMGCLSIIVASSIGGGFAGRVGNLFAVSWLLLGILTYTKTTWALYAGLVLSYIAVLLMFLAIEMGGLMFALFYGPLLGISIYRAHTSINMHRYLHRQR